MNGKTMLYIDQYGERIFAATVRELRGACGGGRVFKVYCDDKDGKAYHIGYGVGSRWFTAYEPFRKAA